MELINSNIIKLYKRYVDYTLILAKPSDISNILAKFNSYHPQIQFTLDYFPDNDVHFLDIKITSDGTTIFRKSTHTGQYSHISSFTLWSQKTCTQNMQLRIYSKSWTWPNFKVYVLEQFSPTTITETNEYIQTFVITTQLNQCHHWPTRYCR